MALFTSEPQNVFISEWFAEPRADSAKVSNLCETARRIAAHNHDCRKTIPGVRTQRFIPGQAHESHLFTSARAIDSLVAWNISTGNANYQKRCNATTRRKAADNDRFIGNGGIAPSLVSLGERWKPLVRLTFVLSRRWYLVCAVNVDGNDLTRSISE